MGLERRIYRFVDSGSDPIGIFISRLEPKMQQKIRTQIKVLTAPQCSFQPPLVKAFRLDRYKGFYELRIRLRQMVRIIFYINTEGDIVLLHGFVKRHERATEQALETARARKLALASGTAGITKLDFVTVADDIIRDVYMHIAGISTVLAGLMSAIAVIGAKMSNNQHRVDQSWDWLKRVWMAWAVINGIGAFISYITPLFNGYAQLP